MRRWIGIGLLFACRFLGATITVTNPNSSGPGSLANAIIQANSSPDTIVFDPSLANQTIILTSGLILTNTYTIDGQSNNITIDANKVDRPFLAQAGSPTVANLTIYNGIGRGGSGGAVTTLSGGGAGGGGAGMGGGCLANATISFIDVIFTQNEARGGAGGGVNATGTGGTSGGAGGGGSGGNGGSITGLLTGGSGGGGFSASETGATASGASGGSGGGSGGAGGDAGSAGTAGGTYGGGGGGGQTGSGSAFAGGAGGHGGGGGGEGDSTATPSGNGGGQGGFGGGGGGTSRNSTGTQGTSVFAGGNGGRNSATNSGMPGGGGAGLGGALFVSENGSITLTYTTQSAADNGFSLNLAAPGSAGTTTAGGATNATNGLGLGTDIFINENGTLAFNMSSGVTLTPSHVIAGYPNGAPSILQNIGPGTLDLRVGTHTFLSDIQMNAGLILINAAGNLGDNSSSLTFDGGSIEVTGNTFSSPQSISLESNGGTIQTDSGVTWTLLGGISGDGPLVKNGPGTLIFASASLNNYTGSTTINSGILKAGNTSAMSPFSSIVLANVSGAMLDLDGNDSDIANLSGGGTSGGEVSLGAGAFLTLAANESTTFAGVISGVGIFYKQGVGTLTLTNTNSYMGTTYLTEGGLTVNGVIQSGTLITDLGTVLKGTGTILSDTTVGGTLSPGNSIGTLTLGSLILLPDSTTSIEFNPSSSSSVVVNNSATIDGTLNLVQQTGSYPATGSYEIVSASSLSGTFNLITGGLPGFTFNVDKIGESLWLFYIQADQPIPVPIAVVLIPTANLSGNALKIANYLNEHASTATLALLNTLTGSSLQQAMNSISPSRNAFGNYIATQTAFSLSNLLNTHIDSFRVSTGTIRENQFASALLVNASDHIPFANNKKTDQKFSAWISAFGELAHLSAHHQNPSFGYNSEAVLAGLDYYPGHRSLVGSSLGYARAHYNEKEHAGDGHINSYFASIYGNAFVHHFYFSPALWGIFNQTKNTRHISFPGFSNHAHANIFVWQLMPHLEIGNEIRQTWGDITPFTAIDWAISWQRSYTEHGASPFNARQQANRSSMIRSETGLRFCEKWQQSWGTFFLKEKVSYVFEKPFGTGTVNTAFVGTPSSFTVTALNQNLNLGAIGVNLLFVIGTKDPVKVDLGYEGEFGSAYRSNNLMLTVSKSF